MAPRVSGGGREPLSGTSGVDESVELKIRDLRSQISQKTTERARAEAAREAAQASILSLETQLKEKFGVETREQAQEEVVRLQMALAESITEVQSALERINA